MPARSTGLLPLTQKDLLGHRMYGVRRAVLQAYSPKANKDLYRLISGLGSEWIWLNSSLKPYPSCRMTHGFIELAGNIRTERHVQASDVKRIEIRMAPTNFLLVGDPTPNKMYLEDEIDAQFSVYFQVSNALSHGSTTGIQANKRLQDLDIRALSGKSFVQTDSSMDGFAAVLRIEWADRTTEERSMRYPLGEVQHPFTRDKVDEKFCSLVQPVFGEERAKAIINLIDDLGSHTIEELFRLLR